MSQKRVPSLSHLYHVPSLQGSAWPHLPVHWLVEPEKLVYEDEHEEEEKNCWYAWAVHSSGAPPLFPSQHLLYPMLPHAMQVPPGGCGGDSDGGGGDGGGDGGELLHARAGSRTNVAPFTVQVFMRVPSMSNVW